MSQPNGSVSAPSGAGPHSMNSSPFSHSDSSWMAPNTTRVASTSDTSCVSSAGSVARKNSQVGNPSQPPPLRRGTHLALASGRLGLRELHLALGQEHLERGKVEGGRQSQREGETGGLVAGSSPGRSPSSSWRRSATACTGSLGTPASPRPGTRGPRSSGAGRTCRSTRCCSPARAPAAGPPGSSPAPSRRSTAGSGPRAARAGRSSPALP